MTPVCLVLWSLSLGLTRDVLRVFVPLKCTCMFLLFAKSFEPVSSVWDVGNNNCGPVFVVAVLVVVICWVVDVVVVVIGDLVGMFELVFPLVKCPVRELARWCKDVLMCSSSLSSKSCVEETVLALCARVLYTFCLAVM